MQGVAKRLKIGVGIFALIGAITLSTTLASNISLNGGDIVEFGQGVAATTACDSNVVITPTSTFVNSESAGEFMFTSVKVSDISESCFGKKFTIKAYKNGQSSPLELYRTGYGDGSYFTYSEIQVDNILGLFALRNAGLLGDDITSTGPDNFTVAFVTGGPPPSEALALASNIDRITIESSDSADNELVAYWNFNNASALGNSAVGNFNLFSCGSPTQGTGLNGSGGLQLDGTSYLTSSTAGQNGLRRCEFESTTPTPSELLGDAQYSMVAWFKTNGGSPNGGIMAWGTPGCGSTTNLRFNGFNNFSNYWFGCDLWLQPPVASFSDNNWHLIVATYDGEFRRMYFDGVLFALDNRPVIPNFQNSQFLIGATIYDQALTGALDNVAVFSRALSEAEISNLYNSYS